MILGVIQNQLCAVGRVFAAKAAKLKVDDCLGMGRSRSLITTSRLRRRAGIGRDGHAIRDAAQIVAVDVLDIPPDIPTVAERFDCIDPALFAILKKVDMRAA